MAKPIPDCYRTLNLYLTVRNASEAIEFYKKAFGAEDLHRTAAPDGRLLHAEMQVGDSRLMLSDEFPEMGSQSPLALGGSPVTIWMYVPDVDEAFKQAVDAGVTVRMPLADMFWGDRLAMVTDPYGHVWALATHKEDLTPEEISRRQREKGL
jgi:PhnB protein